MAGKKTVLCEMAFWEKFSECFSASNNFTDIQSLSQLRVWTDLFFFLCRSKVLFNCNTDAFIQRAQNDERLKYLWKKSTSGESDIQFSGVFSEMSKMEDFPFVVLFKGENSVVNAKGIGVIDIKPTDLSNLDFLFSDCGCAVRDGEEWDWEEIGKKLGERCSNSMIIVDNYVFKHERDNLYRLLNVLLPQNSSIPYQITVFYIEGHETNEQNLRSYISKARPKLKVELEFVKTGKDACNGFKTDFHDRTIITNNYWIGSGAGFDLLKKEYLHYKAGKSTSVSIVFPYFCGERISWADSAYENLITDAKESLKRAQKSSNNRMLIGH